MAMRKDGRVQSTPTRRSGGSSNGGGDGGLGSGLGCSGGGGTTACTGRGGGSVGKGIGGGSGVVYDMVTTAPPISSPLTLAVQPAVCPLAPQRGALCGGHRPCTVGLAFGKLALVARPRFELQ